MATVLGQIKVIMAWVRIVPADEKIKGQLWIHLEIIKNGFSDNVGMDEIKHTMKFVMCK